MKLTPCNLMPFLLAVLTASARTVTISINNQPVSGSVVRTNEVSIGTNEVVEIVSVTGYDQYGYLEIEKDGLKLSWLRPSSEVKKVITGPATLRLWTDAGLGTASVTVLCTLKIEPESFPPGQTIIIPQGTPGANIIMESSGDLVHWTNAPPGLYTNTQPSHLFFRLRAERL